MFNLLMLVVYGVAAGAISLFVMWFLVTNDFFVPRLQRVLFNARFKKILSVRKITGALIAGVCLVLVVLTPPLTRATPDGGSNSFNLIVMIKSMGAVAIAVVVILLIMSVYSIAIMVERYLTYTAAKKQSREFVPRVAQALKHDRIEEAINLSHEHSRSHLAAVVSSGLEEFRAHEHSSEISNDEIEASKRALQQAIAMKTAEFKRGLSGLATIGSTAPFVGLFGTVFGIINAFRTMGDAGQAGIGAVASGISEALFTTALGMLVAVPTVWLFNYFTGRVDGFVTEMDSSASQLIEYLNENRGESRATAPR